MPTVTILYVSLLRCYSPRPSLRRRLAEPWTAFSGLGDLRFDSFLKAPANPINFSSKRPMALPTIKVLEVVFDFENLNSFELVNKFLFCASIGTHFQYFSHFFIIF